MPFITLTTDLGYEDYYLAVVKGTIYSQLPGVNIVDITHAIPPFDLLKTSIVVKNAFHTFPKGTVHIIGVNVEGDLDNPLLAAFYNNHYFIAADNGILSLIFEKKPDKIVNIALPETSLSSSFLTKDVLVKAACYLAKGGSIELLGPEAKEYVTRPVFTPVSEDNVLKGIVVYIDHYGNLITNITQQQFKEFTKGRPFNIYLRGSEYLIEKISDVYSDVTAGEVVALFSSSGTIEIAINKGSAKGLLGLKLGDVIRVELLA